MLLESFRSDPIGVICFGITSAPDKFISAQYMGYSDRAVLLTMRDIQELEYAAGDLVPNGQNAIVSVSLWYLSMEAYINALLKITCFKTNTDYKLFGSQKVAEKLTALLELLDINTIPVKNAGIYNRLNEFTTFRNEIFHDRNIGDTVQFPKTSFSPIPIQCNLIDELQAFLIYLELCSLLRYVIAGLDTMPDIQFLIPNQVFYKKMDKLYNDLIWPSITTILSKHQLETKLNLDPTLPAPLSSTYFAPGDVAIYIHSDSPDTYKYQLNNTQTNITASLFD